MSHFVLRYDFRTPGESADRRQQIYARSLEQAAYADEHGFDAIMLSEHHVADDGYLPSPIVAAAAMAAVTRRTPISVAALLINLYDPVRLAEDIAVLDLISGGRVGYTIGLGYRPEEYAAAGRSWATRARDMETNLDLLVRLLSGEDVERDGVTVRVRPRPISDPHPFLLYGGGSSAAARRAARFGLGFAPQSADRALREEYAAACREAGREPGLVLAPPRGPANVFCADDPERFWAHYGEFVLADAQGYQAWRQPGTRSVVADSSQTVAELRGAGVTVVLTPDELIAQLQDRTIRMVSSHLACGGLPDEPSWESLRLITERVLPAVRPAA